MFSDKKVYATLFVGGLFCCGLLVSITPAAAHPDPVDGACMVNPSNVYYNIDLVTTKKVPGSRRAKGTGAVSYVASPFGVALSSQGHSVYNLDISIDNLRPAKEGVYVAWITTPNLDTIQRIGILDEQMKTRGQVNWNKFLVVISLESSEDDLGEIWQGPIVMRGMSKSGFMHTMAGHGPFQQEPCASFGYN